MAEYDFGYLEGDQLAKAYDIGLLRHLYSFLKPFRRYIFTAVLLIVISIGLDLLLPFITRRAVDHYLVPYYLQLDLRQVSTAAFSMDPSGQLNAMVSSPAIHQNPHIVYVPENVWRELDPAITTRLRRSNAVGKRHWYLAPAEPLSDELAGAYPALFTKANERWLIATDDLNRLSSTALRRLRGADGRGMIFMAIVYLITVILALIISYYQTMCLERAGQGMVLELRMSLYRHLLSRSLTFFGKHPVGKLVTRVNHDVQNLADLFRNLLIGLFRDLFLLAGIAVVMLALDVQLALWCIALAPVAAVLACFFSRMARDVFRRIQGYVGKINTLLNDILAGMGTLKLLGAEITMMDRLEQFNQKHYQAGLSQVKLFAVFLPLVELLGSLAVAMIIWYGGGQVIQNRISLGTLVAFIAYMQMFLTPIKDLAEKYNVLQGAMTSAERIFVLLNNPDRLPVPKPQPKQRKNPEPIRESADIRFEGVSFGYTPDRRTIPYLDLVIPSGRTVAMVGPSGGGKSTIVNLLLRLYDPDQGTVRLGSRDVKDIPPEQLARSVALVSQDIILISGSVADNITLGRPDISLEKVSAALEISGAMSWVKGLPQQMETRLGEGGRQLSQGQRQMMALARALAGEPQILVLDEAFSHVDPLSEKRIHASLPEIMEKRTCLMIAHRLSTARRAQRIIVIRQGRIVEDGDHRSLMTAGGLYADMVRLEVLRQRKEYTCTF